MSQHRSSFVDLGGTRRHIVQWGDAGNPVFLLVHGLLDHARNWDWVAEHFRDRFHVVAPDLRGHGDSDWSEPGGYSLANYVKDLADIVEAVNLPSFHLAGHSLGGQLSLRLAATCPEKVRSLCVIEGIELPIVRDQRRQPVPYPVRLRRWIDKEREESAHRFFASLDEAEERLASHNPNIDPETIAHLARHGTIAVSGKGLRWKYDRACRHRAPEDAHGRDLDDILDAIACPSLLFYGEDSWIPIPPVERLSHLRRHRVVTFEGASHWLHHQARARFLASLTDFLSDPLSMTESERRLHA